MLRNVYQASKDMVMFYEDGDLVGAIDYSDKSQVYIDSAMDNWMNNLMTCETVEKYSAWSYLKNRQNDL